jgi:hypothetical protein
VPDAELERVGNCLFDMALANIATAGGELAQFLHHRATARKL